MDGRDWTVFGLVFFFGVGLMIWHNYQQTQSILAALNPLASAPIPQHPSSTVGAAAVPVFYAPDAADALMNPRNGVNLASPGGMVPYSGFNASPVKWSM